MVKRGIVIHNGQFAYELVIYEDGVIKRIINFTGMDNADYFAGLYFALGYYVKRTGDGSEDYRTWIADHGDVVWEGGVNG